jgi:hypothetical protein
VSSIGRVNPRQYNGITGSVWGGVFGCYAAGHRQLVLSEFSCDGWFDESHGYPADVRAAVVAVQLLAFSGM